MNNKKMYLLQWFGPFSSVQELAKWEEQEEKGGRRYFLYFFHGKRPKDKKTRYYCGMTFKQRSVASRMRNHDHHIHEFEQRNKYLCIWVGTISNIRSVKKTDVKHCEKMLTSYLVQAYQTYDGEIVNKTNYKAPKDTDIYLINEWYNSKNEMEYQRRASGSISRIIPDVLSYYADGNSIYSSKRLKYECDIIKG